MPADSRLISAEPGLPAWTARALPTRPTAPVLTGMRIQAGNELTLSTFDYEVSAPTPG